jgi:phospholipase A1
MKFLTQDRRLFIAAFVTSAFWCTANAEPVDNGDAAPSHSFMEECLMESIAEAAPDTTIGELRAECEHIVAKTTDDKTEDIPVEGMTPVQERMFDDQISYDRNFVISAFQPNYFLGTYSANPNEQPFESLSPGQDILDNAEVKFQISIKAPVWRNMFGTNNDLIAAYTSTSWWQVTSNSAAFRETNYQPELFFRHYGGPKFLGGEVAAADIGFNHQSNGRGEPLSRSWNRVIGRFYLDYDNIAVGFRAWYRLPEDAANDDNPGMHRYYGYGDVTVAYAPNKNTFTAMLRPGTQEGAMELTWSYPITKSIRAYAQYWNGYGESLVDYDARIERFGIGFALNDWLERD